LIPPGTLLAGKYRVIRTVGRGGMGVVVEALHEELDQRVAIKLMAREAAENAEWATRFSREARAAARIKSDHVVRVSDVGKLETGQPYMVMELLEGEDLAALLARKTRLPVPQAIELTLQTCEALAEAHAAGIVHRDLKPANLFITERADEPFVKVLDFGISKVANDPMQVTVTNTSAIVGSPLYMSPEQMRASKSVDARTDIWALGVILHEMITGRPPFDAGTAPELCALVLTAPPSRVTETIPNAPPAIEAIILKCLEKDPAQRYASVAELAHALAEVTPAARPAADRIVRLLSGKARQPAAAGVAAPATAKVAITPDPSNPAVELGDTIASDEKPRVRVVEGPTMVSAGNERDKPLSSPTIAQAPLPEAAPVAPTVAASTAAAWGNTGAPSGTTPSRRAPFVALGGLAATATIAVIAWALHEPNVPAQPAASAPAPKPSIAGTMPVSSAAVTAPAPSVDAATVDINSLPLATTTAAAHTARPTTTTTRPTATVTTRTKPTSDTSEFGGRK
jgi:serine/threonine-protein kinase